PVVVAQDVEIVVGERDNVLLGDGADARPLVGAGQPQTSSDARVDRVIACGATEDEEDRRQKVFLRQPLDHLDTSRCEEPVPRPAANTLVTQRFGVEAARFWVWPS